MIMGVYLYVLNLLLVTLFSGYFLKTENTGTAISNSAYKINLQLIAEELTSPVSLASPYDKSNRLFVCEQPGIIRIIENGKLLDNAFLNITKKIDPLNSNYSEKGLIGLAFHPDFKNNGRFFIHYSAPSKKDGFNHTSVISEFSVSENKNIANSDERIILTLDQPESNHNGGPIVFGPDGYLYISFGDGGGAGDKHGENGNGQDLNTWLGKILRIDVDTKAPYSIPLDNPFINNNGKPEIYAYGLRNPWGISFDRLTGDFFAADVGQNKYEEINLIKKGANYGWRITEGFHCYNPDKNCNDKGITYPINEYSHSVGISVAGGYRYSNQNHQSLFGLYVFGDWTGKLFALNKNKIGIWERQSLQIENEHTIQGYLNAFGEDEDGNIYICTQSKLGPKSNTGRIYMITP